MFKRFSEKFNPLSLFNNVTKHIFQNFFTLIFFNIKNFKGGSILQINDNYDNSLKHQINNVSIKEKSQPEVVKILRSAKGAVQLRLSRDRNEMTQNEIDSLQDMVCVLSVEKYALSTIFYSQSWPEIVTKISNYS